MAWQTVEITQNKTTVQGHQRGLELEFPNKLKASDALVVNGRSMKVESWAQDERDDIVHVLLADAGVKEKSDDKPTKGASGD